MAGKKSIRKNLSKKTRFEVLKRDNFTCQYCGKQAPDVVLEVDHIIPVAEGGDNSFLNLLTSCWDCNHGKGKRKLDDNLEIKKQKEELNILQQKKEQLLLLQKWKKELEKTENLTFSFFEREIIRLCGYTPDYTEHGIKTIKGFIKKYDHKELLLGITKAFEQYYQYNDDINEREKNFSKAFRMIPKIISCMKEEKNNPNIKNVYYCRAILKNRLSYFDPYIAKKRLIDLLEHYYFEDVKNICCEIRNWSMFTAIYNQWMGAIDG